MVKLKEIKIFLSTKIWYSLFFKKNDYKHSVDKCKKMAE